MELEHCPKSRNFDWEKAKIFYYIAKLGSFANAARFLNISQSALSRQIIYLEEQSGCPLFSRHSGGIKLTRKGEELFAIVEMTFINLKQFTQTHMNVGTCKRRKIRISSTHAVAAYILNDLILDYTLEHPDIFFEMISNDQTIDVVLNDVDIAIRPYDPFTQGVFQEPLFALEKKLYASPLYLEKYGVPQAVEDLVNHHIIVGGLPELYPYADINWILTLGMPKGKLHHPIFVSNSLECLIGAAKRGVGIIGSYDTMTILQNAHLEHILPDTTHKEPDGYFICPSYLEKDTEILNIKKYLKEKLSSR